MSGIPAERQNLADRLANALRRFEREGGDKPVCIAELLALLVP